MISKDEFWCGVNLWISAEIEIDENTETVYTKGA